MSNFNEILARNTLFVKEHVGMFKAANNYDILDPETKEILLECREPNLGCFTKFFRFTGYKAMTPFDVVVSTKEGQQVVRVKRGTSIFRSKVQVFDENEQHLGTFKQTFRIGGGFRVLDPQGKIAFDLKGKWTTWEYSFNLGDKELGKITKKWAGLGKEMFTTADNYMLTIADDVPADHPVRKLIIAAAMSIDMVLKEKK